MQVDLSKDVKYIKGAGPVRAKSLNKLGIFTIKDLITYFPRSYEDRGIITKISDINEEKKYTIEARALTNVNVKMLGRYKSIERLVVTDESETMSIVWFNQPYIAKERKLGETYRFFGKVTIKGNTKTITSPVFDSLDKNVNTGKIIPLYSTIGELKQSFIRKIIENALNEIDHIEETIPKYIIDKYHLMTYNDAIRAIHFPSSFEEFKKARYRLVFDELLSMQLGLLKLKFDNESEVKGIQYDKNVKMSDVINDLPFKLTKAQLRVLDEINSDMENFKPMNRLLQGDVGSRKNNSCNDCII